MAVGCISGIILLQNILVFRRDKKSDRIIEVTVLTAWPKAGFHCNIMK